MCFWFSDRSPPQGDPAINFNELRSFDEELRHEGYDVIQGDVGELSLQACSYEVTKNGARFMLKRYRCDNEGQVRQAHTYVNALLTLNHRHILKFKESFVCQPMSFCVITESADSGTLETHLNRLANGTSGVEPQLALDWTRQLCAALEHIHDRNMIHRNICPRSIHLTQDEREVRIGEFGVSKLLDQANPPVTMCGEADYQAPEMGGHREYDAKVDMYSLGVVVTMMCSLSTHRDARWKGTYDRRLVELVVACLRREAARRKSAREALHLLNRSGWLRWLTS